MRFAISLLCLAGIAAGPLHAQTSRAEAGRAPFRQCGTITDRNERLDCFDRTLNESEPAQPLPPVVTRKAETKRNSDQFGFKGSPAEKQQRSQAGPQPRPAEDSQIDLQVARATEDGLGRWTIEAANGVAWRQTETVPTFQPPRKGQPVSIEKGALGSYLLRAGKQPVTRVERIR